MNLTSNLEPSYRDLKDPTSCQHFYDTLEQKRVIDLRPCHMYNCIGIGNTCCDVSENVADRQTPPDLR